MNRVIAEINPSSSLRYNLTFTKLLQFITYLLLHAGGIHTQRYIFKMNRVTAEINPSSPQDTF